MSALRTAGDGRPCQSSPSASVRNAFASAVSAPSAGRPSSTARWAMRVAARSVASSSASLRTRRDGERPVPADHEVVHARDDDAPERLRDFQNHGRTAGSQTRAPDRARSMNRTASGASRTIAITRSVWTATTNVVLAPAPNASASTA